MCLRNQRLCGFAMCLFATVICSSRLGSIVAEEADTSRVHQRLARETLTVVEMDHGDALQFELRNGQQRTFVLEKTSAHIIERTRGGVVYSFECELHADGQPMLLRRYVCSQETFYEPWVINGVRLWLSSSRSVFGLVPIRYPCQHYDLDADAIIVVQDATLPICPQSMRPWFPFKEHFIDIGACYNGDDPWLGPYLGEACHVGLDINMPKGTPLYAPIDFDNHWIFSGEHRWRGVRRWANGDVWGLQSHHIDKLVLDEHTQVRRGTQYANAAGKEVGAHEHSHFEFRLGPEVMNRGWQGGIEVDPWILFWQIFETDKANREQFNAEMEALAPGETGKPVRFSRKPSRSGNQAAELTYYWTFGDGGWSNETTPEHTFIRVGVYPVTLVVDDGRQRVSRTQHVTINGEAIDQPALTLNSPDEVSFRSRPVPVADVYGWSAAFTPHTLRLRVAPPSAQSTGKTTPRCVLLRNSGGGVLPEADQPQIKYLTETSGWLQLACEGKGNEQQLVVTADAHSLLTGRHDALVTVGCPGAINSRQGFRVELTVRPTPTMQEITVDDRDEGFYATPYFWVGHQFLRCPERGYRRRYLTNGARPTAGEFVRFTPDLAPGRYEVWLHEQSPLAANARFPVRVCHASGETTFDFIPDKANTRALGIYDFSEGYVEFHAEGSKGSVVADALVFRPAADN